MPTRKQERVRHARLLAPALILAASLAVSVVAAVPAGAATRQSAQVEWSAPDRMGEVVDGAWARIARTDDALQVKLHTTGLRPGHAYTMWLIVFNEPQSCTSNPGPERACGMPDAFNPLSGASHIWGDGAVVGTSGVATFSSRRAKGYPGEFPHEPGLTAPGGAEVEVVVRDHGPAVTGSDQTTTLTGGCLPVPPGHGSPGTYVCENQQQAVFPTP